MSPPSKVYYVIESNGSPTDVVTEQAQAMQRARELASAHRPARIVATVPQQLEFDLSDSANIYVAPSNQTDGTPELILDDEPTEPTLCKCYDRFCNDPANFMEND